MNLYGALSIIADTACLMTSFCVFVCVCVCMHVYVCVCVGYVLTSQLI